MNSKGVLGTYSLLGLAVLYSSTTGLHAQAKRITFNYILYINSISYETLPTERVQ